MAVFCHHLQWHVAQFQDPINAVAQRRSAPYIAFTGLQGHVTRYGQLGDRALLRCTRKHWPGAERDAENYAKNFLPFFCHYHACPHAASHRLAIYVIFAGEAAMSHLVGIICNRFFDLRAKIAAEFDEFRGNARV